MSRIQYKRYKVQTIFSVCKRLNQTRVSLEAMDIRQMLIVYGKAGSICEEYMFAEGE